MRIPRNNLGVAMKKKCLFIDVFTDVPYAGNQLAVFPDGKGLSTGQMQKLAQEIYYSETVFIFENGKHDADFAIRIFTPRSELPFAGHPVLGTAYSIMNILDVWKEKKDLLRLETGVGVIPLEKKGKHIWMVQNEPRFLKQYAEREEIAGLVGLEADDIAGNLPVQTVFTGNSILIVPVKSLEVMGRVNGNVNRMEEFFRRSDAMAPYLFTLETVNKSAAVHTRLPAGHMGIPEDPATGSAAGPLTAYLLKYGVFGNKFKIENEQGLEMGRPSTILMDGEIRGGRYIIKIGGACAYAGKGEFAV
jgi:trans-2,3-dihydro-3-hydroxyanthranilate isomerase